jgi:hypothetical protein
VKTEDRRSAEAGEQFYVTASHLQRPLGVTDASTPVTVQPKTAGTEGQWICISCCIPIESQFAKDTHCDERAPRKSALVKPDARARHVLAWRSFKTGNVEVP